jgi:prevent-host-death family protein
MMNIKPSAAIRKNYNEISELCKRSGEPVYLTKNGEGDLVVMDIEAFARRESMLRLRETLISAEEGRLRGEAGYSAADVAALMKTAVQEVLDGQRK